MLRSAVGDPDIYTRREGGLMTSETCGRVRLPSFLTSYNRGKGRVSGTPWIRYWKCLALALKSGPKFMAYASQMNGNS